MVRARLLSYEQCTIYNVTIVIYDYSNYMFGPPGPSSGSLEDYKNKLYIRGLLNGVFWGWGRENKGTRSRYVVPYVILQAMY
jgi:hypothetical protein